MKLGRLATLLVALAVTLGAGAPARAQTAIEEATRLSVRPPVWEVTAGVRTTYIKSAGFDPFSTNDAMEQFSLAGTRTIVHADRFAFVAGLGLDVGSSSASARGAPSTLTLTRLSVLIEGRYQPASRLYFFARLGPGLVHGTASIDDASSSGSSGLSAAFDVFSLDASAGGAFCLAGIGTAHVGAWVVADGGYGWAPAQNLLLAPSLGGDQNKAGALDLGTLAARGGFFRIALAFSY